MPGKVKISPNDFPNNWRLIALHISLSFDNRLDAAGGLKIEAAYDNIDREVFQDDSFELVQSTVLEKIMNRADLGSIHGRRPREVYKHFFGKKARREFLQNNTSVYINGVHVNDLEEPMRFV